MPYATHRGIPGISKDREARIEAIIQQLVTGNEEYDFVFLQEVWSKADYHIIASKVRVDELFVNTFTFLCRFIHICIILNFEY